MAYIGVSPSNGVRRKHTYTATASQTTFSGAGSEGVSLSYRDSNYVDVYVNGVKLGDADYTATSGTSIVLGVGAAVNDIVEIITYDVFSVADTVSKADGGTFDGNVAMAGTLGVTGDLTVDTNTLYVDSANNRVGVGTVSPDVPVEISVAGNSITNVLKLTTTSSGTVPALQFEGDASGTQHIIARVRAQQDDASNGGIVFETENSGTVAERMRIDSSGNLLVGKTSADSGATVGVELNTNDTAYFTRSGGAGVNINRTSTDGNIAVLQKDGTTIGVLGVNGGNNLFISSAIANHGGLIFSDGGASTPQMNPISSGSTLVDNAMNIGSASYRFKDLYLSSQAITSNTGTAAAPNFAISSGALGNNGMFCPAANTIAFSNAATERMRIDSSGNVGIGTSTPLSLLDIAVEASDTRRFLVNYDDSVITVKGSNQNSNPESLRIVADGFRVSTGTSGSGTERMRIDNSGNVGIGTSSPNTTTQISKSTTSTDGSVYPTLKIENTSAGTGNSYARFQLNGGNGTTGFTLLADGRSSNSDLSLRTTTSTPMSFYTNNSERMRITSGGGIAINATGASAQVHVNVDNLANLDGIRIVNSTNNTGGYFIRFQNSQGSVAGYIEHTGTSTVAYRTSSDHRLKENVVTMTGAIDRVKQLLPKRFNFIDDGTDTTVDGFLAHEAQTVVPEAVGGTHNEVDEDGNPVYQGIDQSKLVPLLTGALKEAITKIEALETRIEALENA